MNDKILFKKKVLNDEFTQKLLNQQYSVKSLKPIKLQELKSKNHSALLNNISTNNEVKLPSITLKNSLRIFTASNDTSELNTIKEHNPPSIIHSRNLDIIKRLSEKTKKLKEERKLKLSQPHKTPLERLNSLKKSVCNNNINSIPFEHRRLELIINEENKIISDNTFYYYEIIHGGNNSEIIEKCLKKRGQWKLYERGNDNYIYSNSINITEGNNNHYNYYNYLSNENNPLPNLLWSHSSSRIDFNEFSKYRPGHFKKVTNHFENHKEISNKLFLFINMMSFCESNNLDLFSIFPVTFPLKYDSEDYFNSMSAFTYIFNNINKFVSDDVLDYKYRNLFEFELKGRIGYKTSFHIPNNHFEGKNLWLIKAIDLNRGRCIKISDNINGIINIIQHFYKGMKKNFQKNETIDENNKINENDKKELLLPSIKNNNKTPNNNRKKPAALNRVTINPKSIFSPKNKTSKRNLKIFKEKSKEKSKKEQKPKVIYYSINQLPEEKTYQSGIVILQKYIEKPLCYCGRKCDMRLWVLLTWDFNVYLFKEGHFKASSVLFDLNSQNSYVHLTNYSVQKYSENFQKFESGNEISFKNFELSVNNEISVKKDLLPKIKDIILYTMKSVKNRINKAERKICFEIFGYDFIFDVNYHPYLLEVNTNPGLEISSPLIAMLIPRLIDDAFKLTIDKIFPLSNNNIENMKKNVCQVEGYDDNENMFEFLGNVLNEENLYRKNSEEIGC